MSKSKLRVKCLTLAPRGIRWVQTEEDDEAIDEEAARILLKQHLHRVVEISVESSLAHKLGRHVHWIDDRLSGCF
jgi:hypothetical protein